MTTARVRDAPSLRGRLPTTMVGVAVHAEGTGLAARALGAFDGDLIGGSGQTDDAVRVALAPVDDAGLAGVRTGEQVEVVPDEFRLGECLVHGHRFGAVLLLPDDPTGSLFEFGGDGGGRPVLGGGPGRGDDRHADRFQ